MSEWKEATRNLVAQHNQHGVGIAFVNDLELGPESEVVNLTKQDELLVVEGKELTAKQVRRYLWPWRRARTCRRERVVLWSAFDRGRSFVGVGAVTSKKAAERMDRGQAATG